MARSMSRTDARSLISVYLRDVLERMKKYGRWDLELHYVPTAAKILALDPDSQAQIALALFRTLSRLDDRKTYGMLGKLSGKLLRRTLPSSDPELVTMLQCAARALYPGHASIDAGWFLVQMLARRDDAPSAKVKAALKKLAQHRGKNVNNYGRVTPESRKVCDACAKLIARA